MTSDSKTESRIRDSFRLQKVMSTIGAELVEVAPGRVRITLPYRGDLTQQHGYLHAGIVTTIVDSACGYAAYTLMPEDSGVLAVEFKVNLMAPAKGERFMAIGEVERSGRTLTVCTGRCLAIDDGKETVVAMMQATMMCLRDRGIQG